MAPRWRHRPAPITPKPTSISASWRAPALARAVYGAPSLYILDERNAHLDGPRDEVLAKITPANVRRMVPPPAAGAAS